MSSQNQSKKSKITALEAILFVLVLALSGALVYLKTQQKQSEWDKVVSVSQHVIRDLSESGWNPEIVQNYATPQLKEWVKNSKDLDALNKALQQLGSIKENKPIDLLAVNKISAVAVTQVEYTNGKAAITVNFKKEGDKWLVDKINVNSPDLKNETAVQKPAPATPATPAEPAQQ